MGSKNSIWTYQTVEIVSREDYLSQFKLMNLKQILGNTQHRVGNKNKEAGQCYNLILHRR